MLISKLLRGAALILALGVPCRAALTTITGTLNKADGTPYTGNFTVRWATFVNAANLVVRSGYVNVSVTAGTFSVGLEASGTCMSYTVEYVGLRQGSKQTEYWVVPVSSSGPVDIATVRHTAAITCPANTWLCVFSVSAAPWQVTCVHNLNSVNVGVEVTNIAGTTVIPGYVERPNVNTVVVTFSAFAAGTIRVFSSLRSGTVPNCTITAATSVTCGHTLTKRPVKVYVWNSAGVLVRPAYVERPTPTTVRLTFDYAFTGMAAIV